MAREEVPFVAAADCIDGRTTSPVARLAAKDKGARRVHLDAVTEPGMVGRLDERDEAVIERVKRGLGISIEHHGSDRVYVVGHASCAGNRVEDRRHKQQTLDAAKVVQTLVPRTRSGEPRVLVVPTFVAPDANGRWRARPLRRSA